MERPVCLDLLIVDISKVALHMYWYDYIKLMCGNKAKNYATETDSLCKI